MQLLLIEDNRQIPTEISTALERKGWEVLTEHDAECGFATFTQAQPRIVILDLATPSETTELLDRILHADPGASVIVTSDEHSEEAAVQVIRDGACDYLTKPLDTERLLRRLDSLREEANTRQRTLALDRELVEACTFEGIVSRSPLMLEIFAKIRRVAPHFRTALISGATGTGKELIAKALHRLSPAENERFVACNCSALVETLVESELFGYVKGAFTGATHDRPGLFESADRGTLFLDEIGELSLGTQAKLLRVLQDHRVRRVGSAVAREVNIRLIAATNRDLRTMILEGTFREDLYYRLAMVEIALPRLEERREDLPLLQRYFIERFAAEYKKPIAGFTRRAQALITSYSWRGNIRELENVIGHACMMAEERFIDVSDLPPRLQEAPKHHPSISDGLFSLQEAQKRHIVQVLGLVGGNKLKAAKILGVGRNTIYKMLSRLKANDRNISA